MKGSNDPVKSLRRAKCSHVGLPNRQKSSLKRLQRSSATSQELKHRTAHISCCDVRTLSDQRKSQPSGSSTVLQNIAAPTHSTQVEVYILSAPSVARLVGLSRLVVFRSAGMNQGTGRAHHCEVTQCRLPDTLESRREMYSKGPGSTKGALER